ncbi:MAG TPA: penicillin acylase family protein [Actinomycetes bacterium]
MSPRRRPLARTANLVAALLALAVLGQLAWHGGGPLPALGPMLEPTTGVWAGAANAELPRDGTLRLRGLRAPVRVVFEPGGVPHVRAASRHDLWLAFGYLHARFRLFEMDLARRQASGRLAEVLGPDQVASDELELRLGLRHTAEAAWAELRPGDPAREALLAYADGVNDRIAEARDGHRLPSFFTLLGYQPQPWTPVDSLVVQGNETQLLTFDDSALINQILSDRLGAARAADWFPVQPPNQALPYDPGPYAGAARAGSGGRPRPPAAIAGVEGLHRQLRAVPQVRSAGDPGNSNAWAVDGSLTASGKPLLAGDPHLPLSLPSIWFQIDADAPGYQVSGVSIPGLPGVVIGRNRHVAWSLTSVENQATFFYAERTDRAHPGRYFWRGAWRPLRNRVERLKVKGEADRRVVVPVTVHGPVLTRRHLTVAVDWLGAEPSPDLRVLLRVGQAASGAEVREALRDWASPSQAFVYADDGGHIGVVAAGRYPTFAKGVDPSRVLPGTGEADLTGSIPFEAIPQAHDPPSHMVVTANQRPVGPGYPWYIGTSLVLFGPSYRAAGITRALQGRTGLTMADMRAIQLRTIDPLATSLLPWLLRALPPGGADQLQGRMRALLAAWDRDMREDSAAAAVWGTFWDHYLDEVFGPWWRAKGLQAAGVSLDELAPRLTPTLETWTLRDPDGPSLRAPDGARRSAEDLARRAFAGAAAELRRRLGPDPTRWRWGSLNRLQIASLSEIDSLGYGPAPRGGDERTVNVNAGPLATDGPSWRFIADLGSGAAAGIYPGGQSEDPASPWYRNGIDDWWEGRDRPLRTLDQAAALGGSVTWSLRP